jgi:DNA polymerase III delta subunit
MIYLFTWNNDYLIREEVLRWKDGFKEKHWEENITHVSFLDWNSKNTIPEVLVSRSIFAEKRLVIIDWFPFSGEKAFSWASDLESQILWLLESVPKEVLVLFVSVNPDKRKSGFKHIKKVSQVKEFNIAWEDEVYSILQRKYWKHIDGNTLRRLIFLKWGDLQKSLWELEKLLISYNQITSSHLQEHIIPEFEESIFVFIDTLLQRDAAKIFSELDNLITYSNLYTIYQSIVANLRVFLYIELLKSKKIAPKEIGDILKLWNRSFLINKSHKSKYKNISKLYIDLLDFDKNMKFWKFIGSEEEDMKRELERVFLKFIT